MLFVGSNLQRSLTAYILLTHNRTAVLLSPINDEVASWPISLNWDPPSVGKACYPTGSPAAYIFINASLNATLDVTSSTFAPKIQQSGVFIQMDRNFDIYQALTVGKLQYLMGNIIQPQKKKSITTIFPVYDFLDSWFVCLLRQGLFICNIPPTEPIILILHHST